MHYRYTVMPFGVANAWATFQAMINMGLHESLDLGVVCYGEEILLYF